MLFQKYLIFVKLNSITAVLNVSNTDYRGILPNTFCYTLIITVPVV